MFKTFCDFCKKEETKENKFFDYFFRLRSVVLRNEIPLPEHTIDVKFNAEEIHICAECAKITTEMVHQFALAFLSTMGRKP